MLQDDCRQPDPVRHQHSHAQGSPCSGGLLEHRPPRYPFEPAFPEKLYFPEARPADDPRRTFLFYARPNNVRNLFLHGLAAIDEAISADILDPAEWRFHFVGSGIPSVQLTRGVTPIVSENLPWPAYAALIRGVDLGLSLMSTPHPSYPPLDLAACGAVAVTNRYGVKQDLNSYSSNIICSDLAHSAIVEGIAAGVRLAQDRKTRHRNYENQQLSRSWDSSLSAVLDELSDWALVFTARLAPVAYQDPWTATFAERKATLLSGDPRIAYYYARPDTSTFRYRAFNMIEALRYAEPDASAAWLTADDGRTRDGGARRDRLARRLSGALHNPRRRPDRAGEEPWQAGALRHRRSRVRRPLHTPRDGVARPAGR